MFNAATVKLDAFHPGSEKWKKFYWSTMTCVNVLCFFRERHWSEFTKFFYISRAFNAYIEVIAYDHCHTARREDGEVLQMDEIDGQSMLYYVT